MVMVPNFQSILTKDGVNVDTLVQISKLNSFRAFSVSELELLRTLAEAEDDVQNGRMGSMQESLDKLRESLVNRKNENV